MTRITGSGPCPSNVMDTLTFIICYDSNIIELFLDGPSSSFSTQRLVCCISCGWAGRLTMRRRTNTSSQASTTYLVIEKKSTGGYTFSPCVDWLRLPCYCYATYECTSCSTCALRITAIDMVNRYSWYYLSAKYMGVLPFPR